MARADFNYIPVNQTLNDSNPTWEVEFPVETGALNVVDDGYLTITVRSVDSQGHQIRINGQQLSGFDIPTPPGNSNAWFTYMDRIQPGVLQSGTNRLEITRIGNDSFSVKDLVVHWREAA